MTGWAGSPGNIWHNQEETSMKSPSLFTSIALIGTGILSIIEIYALQVDNHYKYDGLILLATLWLLYSARRTLHLHPIHFALAVVFLIAHNAGVFGAYEHTFLTISYDTYVHTYFGLVAGLISLRAWHRHNTSPWAYIVIPMILLLLSVGHELLEIVGAQLFGPGQGVFRIGPGDLGRLDTVLDLRNNLLGTILAFFVYQIPYSRS